jgi:hypothetical protein
VGEHHVEVGRQRGELVLRDVPVGHVELDARV